MEKRQNRDEFILRYGIKGVNQSADPALLDFHQVQDAVNVQIKNSSLTCRPGVKIHDLGVEGAFQGATFYNPSRGLSQQSFGSDEGSIVARIGGKHYKITPSKSGVETSEMEVTSLDTEETYSSEDYHMAFMTQAENYIISQDGNGSTWIWDGESAPVFSSGYDSVDKEESRLANGASAVGYAHGRVIQVVNNRQVLVGDIIHKKDLSSAENILDMTEQVYWATGSFFSPPSELGRINAVKVLPLRDTAHGHGDLMFHTDEGIFSLDLTKYPRDKWVESAIAKHVLLDTGASGFYAITIFDGDQVFLSRHGLQTLRSARAESQLLGNPFLPISEQVKNYIGNDLRENFRFASVEKFVEERRVMMTTQHVLGANGNRGARGILVINFLPQAGAESAWEGLWTFPPEFGLLNQLVSGVFNAQERLFAFGTAEDGKVRLMEFSKEMSSDILPDGDTRKIRWQVLTKAHTGGDEAGRKTYEKAVMTVRRITDEFKWKASSKTDESNWTDWHTGCADGAQCGLEAKPVRDIRVRLGSPPQETKTGTTFQMLLEMEGNGSLESIKLSVSKENGGNGSPSREGECDILVSEEQGDSRFNPFEYSEQ